jgi:signal transduction histidine kinase
LKYVARKLNVSRSRSNGSWLTLLLLLVVIVPSACLLWFMNKAVGNEQLAMRQRLAEAYRGQLAVVQQLLETHWQQTADALDTTARETSAAVLFTKQVRENAVDALVIYDTNGMVLYPDRISVSRVEPLDPDWIAAHQYEGRDLAAAAALYGRLAEQATNSNLAAQALQAQARCLVQAGQPAAAIGILTGAFTDARYQMAKDGDGRLIAPNAELMAIELLKPIEPERARARIEILKARLNDYEMPMPASQRRFLMRELQRTARDERMFPTLAAEDLAARYVEAGGTGFRDPVVRLTPLAEVWQFGSSRGAVVALHRTDSLLGRMHRVVPEVGSSKVRVDFIRPGQEANESLLSQMAGDTLQGWRLSLSLQDQQLFEAGSKQRARIYVAVAVLAVGIVTALALLAMGLIRRQSALTQLRNDLVANVTHELKTPLASTRLLVETLLNADKIEEKVAREYLELIARENIRLSRLIENFLTFSRIERNKYTFDFREVTAATIAQAAVAAVRERFNTPNCRFEVRVPAETPFVRADADAMVTALLNLLDNAYKYTGETKQIGFHVGAEIGCVKFSIQDNGIGLTPRDAKQVFKRFYQVNEHLSRSSGGAGLGLSIVDFIVTAHQGKVQVESDPEKGSTFTISIPTVKHQQPQEINS